MPPTKKSARDYRHRSSEAVLRPEGGAQDSFPTKKRKANKSYRFDSSMAPELAWDEGEMRGETDALIGKILDSDDLESAKTAARKLQSLTKPFLNWAGKAERGCISVPTLPLFTHERLSTAAVLDTLQRHRRDRRQQLLLFNEGNKSISEKIRGAYEHKNGWQNRLILGDSLQVMNSLLEYEDLGGAVQMVYMDPPYGIKFGSNFQPFVRKRDVKDGDDAHMVREPEMVQAYRDTWTLGTHSWLTYMRDRLLLVKELLTDSGSCFVQISDENVHLVRSVMDEVFGRENFVSLISYRTRGVIKAKFLTQMNDYILWYAKDKQTCKYNRLYVTKKLNEDSRYQWVELVGGERRRMTSEERSNSALLPKNSRAFIPDKLSAMAFSESTYYEFSFNGVKYYPAQSRSWQTSKVGMAKLEAANRLIAPAGALCFVRYYDDYPVSELSNVWTDTQGELDKSYVVQTSEKVIQRCMLMTTDPGDLVFDPTCGSGTTAYVAEQWGRRWITADVSRVPLLLTRERLLTATFPYYELKDESRGPSGGFVYQRKQNKRGEEVGGIVPHVTLKSIANDEPPAEEVLVDKPELERDVARISGPFCFEALLPKPLSPEDEVPVAATEKLGDGVDHYTRMVEVLRLSPRVRLSGNKSFDLQKVRPPARALNLHAEAEDDKGNPIAVVFGPPNGAISDPSVVAAAKEASNKDYARLLVVAFAIDPHARETIDTAEEIWGIAAQYVQASADLSMPDLLKNTRFSEVFAVCGQPDVTLQECAEKAEDGGKLWQVHLRGLDVFDPVEMEIYSKQGDDVPCWMLDTDYDGQCFRAGQVFFPRTAAWDKIKKAIKADFADSVWEHLRGNVSAPFVAGEKIAVKVLDDRGNELLVVKKVGE